MKKILTATLMFVLMFSMVGCDPKIENLNKDELIADTVKIEVLYYENKAPELLDVDAREKPSFNFEKATSIATLDKKHFEEVINEVAEIDYLNFGTALNEPIGKTLVLYQSNGNMIVLYGCIYTNEENKTFYFGDCYVFDKAGVFIEYIGKVGYLFIDKIEKTYF